MKGLNLFVKPGSWQIFSGRQTDKAFLPLKQQVFDRDLHTCQFCGFQAKEFLEVVNLDRNYRNNRISNLVTACPFCAQCQFLETVGFDAASGGQIIYLPELSQTDLNALCHVLFCSMQNGGDYKDTAQNIYRNLRLRCQIVEKQIGVGASNPRALGQLIMEYQASHPKMSQDFFKSLRLLPSYSKFKPQLEMWSKSAMDEIATTESE